MLDTFSCSYFGVLLLINIVLMIISPLFYFDFEGYNFTGIANPISYILSVEYFIYTKTKDKINSLGIIILFCLQFIVTWPLKIICFVEVVLVLVVKLIVKLYLKLFGKKEKKEE